MLVVLKVTEEFKPEFFPFKKNGSIIFVAGRSIVLGPFRSRKIILPFRFSGDTEWKAIFDCTQNKGIFCRCKIYTNGQISIVIYNQIDVPQHITSKMKLVCRKVNIDWIIDVNGVKRALRNDTKRIQMVTSSVDKHDTMSLAQRLREMFPNAFCDKVRSANGNFTAYQG